jgi:hypothetical protein
VSGGCNVGRELIPAGGAAETRSPKLDIQASKEVLWNFREGRGDSGPSLKWEGEHRQTGFPIPSMVSENSHQQNTENGKGSPDTEKKITKAATFSQSP